MKNLHLLFSTSLITLLTFLSCNLIDSNEGEARIILGKQIEGIRIGDDYITMVKKLGPPSYSSGGNFSGSIYYYHDDTEYNLMMIGISEDKSLGLGVLFVWVWPPYNGKTNEGVGLGMKWENIMKKIPSPDEIETRPNGETSNYFYFDQNTFNVRYNSKGIIDLIVMARK